MKVTVRDVSVGYDDVRALDRVSVEIPTGEWLGVIGPNGAGKSTLLKVIAGLVPHQGSVTFDGVARPERRREAARQCAYVPQRPELPDEFSVLEYVLLGRTPYVPPLGSERTHDRAVAEEAIDRLELRPLARRRLGSISGGESQRAVLARAICQEAPLLLLDEPTTALDLGHQQQVLELVDELRHERGITVIAAVHDLVLATAYCDRLMLLDRGAVVAHGDAATVVTPEQLRDRFGALVTPFTSATGVTHYLPIRRGVTPAGPSAPVPGPGQG